jgi:hypothetical protein
LPATLPETFWRFATAANAANSSPAVVDGKVLHVTWYDKLYCYNALTNRLNILWTFSPVDQPVNQFGSAPSIANGLIFVGDGNGLRALRPVGRNLSPGLSAGAANISGLKVTFTASGYDRDGAIAAYFWQFGDGTSANVQNPTHSYPTGGTYIASVRVTDNLGAQNEATVFVSVKPNPPLHMNIRRETNGVWLAWEGGVETRQYLERCFELADSNTLWQTIWTNRLPVPPVASF